MRIRIHAIGLAAALLVLTSGVCVPRGVAAAASAAKPTAGSMVIVFRDGHRQVIPLADIDKVEYPVSEPAATASSSEAPSRGRFVGKWEAGDGAGGHFFITLNEDGKAFRSIGDEHGKWAYVNGEARITWNDGKLDALRKVGGRFQKFAYEAGKSFTDAPANVTDARNTSPKSI